MFEGLKRFVRKISNALETPPDSVDNPRPKRVDPDPPKDHWYARTASRSLRAAARDETKVLDALDKVAPPLSRETSKQVDDLLTKASSSARR